MLLGSFWYVFGLLKVLESSFRRRFLVFMVSLCSLLFRPRVRRFVFVNLSTYLLVYSSTHGPSALSTRPGGLRAARLNPPPPEGSERVQIGFRISLSNSSNSKSLARARAFRKVHFKISLIRSYSSQFKSIRPKIGPKPVQNRSKHRCKF